MAATPIMISSHLPIPHRSRTDSLAPFPPQYRILRPAKLSSHPTRCIADS